MTIALTITTATNEWTGKKFILIVVPKQCENPKYIVGRKKDSVWGRAERWEKWKKNRQKYEKEVWKMTKSNQNSAYKLWSNSLVIPKMSEYEWRQMDKLKWHNQVMATKWKRKMIANNLYWPTNSMTVESYLHVKSIQCCCVCCVFAFIFVHEHLFMNYQVDVLKFTTRGCIRICVCVCINLNSCDY